MVDIMKNYLKRFLASFLCVCLILSMCGITATAEVTGSVPEKLSGKQVAQQKDLETMPEGLTNITFRYRQTDTKLKPWSPTEV
jgi:hypothetical protein